VPPRLTTYVAGLQVRVKSLGFKVKGLAFRQSQAAPYIRPSRLTIRKIINRDGVLCAKAPDD